MLAEAGGARIPHRPDAGVAVIVALRAERRCVRRHGPGLSLIQSGPGAARAAAAAARALAAGARGVVSFGLAGGLAADARPGRLLLPRSVLTSSEQVFDVDVRWHARLTETLAADFDFDDRPLYAADDVLEDPAAKRRAAARGVAAVDLESGAIAAAAAQANVPFVVVRAVADGRDDALPSGVASWVAEDGETRVAPVVAAALVPRNWPMLWTLARRYSTARQTLERAVQRLGHEDFLFE